MAHNEQRVFFSLLKKHFPLDFKGSVLEVGSLDINGSVRDFFDADEYIGCDVGPGPGVDIVMGGQDLEYPEGHFDTTVSAECFEHNPYWRETFSNMVRMTADGGLVAITCAGEGRPEHGTARTDAGSSPLTVGLGWEYYANVTPADFLHHCPNTLRKFGNAAFWENPVSHDTYFAGIIAGSDPKWDDFKADMRAWLPS